MQNTLKEYRTLSQTLFYDFYIINCKMDLKRVGQYSILIWA